MMFDKYTSIPIKNISAPYHTKKRRTINVNGLPSRGESTAFFLKKKKTINKKCVEIKATIFAIIR